MWLFAPRTKTSMRLDPHETAPGSSSKTPPSRCQPLQVPPCPWTIPASIHLYHSALSPPWAKQSSRFAPQDAAAGPDKITPPRSSHPRQAAPSHHLCHMRLSIPRTKQSMRLGPQETVAGAPSMTPPRSSQGCHAPSHHLCHM